MSKGTHYELEVHLENIDFNLPGEETPLIIKGGLLSGWVNENGIARIDKVFAIYEHQIDVFLWIQHLDVSLIIQHDKAAAHLKDDFETLLVEKDAGC